MSQMDGFNEGPMRRGPKDHFNCIEEAEWKIRQDPLVSNGPIVGERPPALNLFYGWWLAGPGCDGSGVGDLTLGAKQIRDGETTLHQYRQQLHH